MKMPAFLGLSLSALGLVAAPIAQAATLPTTANISVEAGTRVGQGAVSRVHRASTGAQDSSNLLGLPLIGLALGAAVVVVVAVVVVATNNSSTPGS